MLVLKMSALERVLIKVGRQEVLMLKAQAKRNMKIFLLLFPFNKWNRSSLFLLILTDDYR